MTKTSWVIKLDYGEKVQYLGTLGMDGDFYLANRKEDAWGFDKDEIAWLMLKEVQRHTWAKVGMEVREENKEE